MSEPIGDENRIDNLALKKAVFAGLGKDGRSDKGAVGRELRSGGEKSCGWGLGAWWRLRREAGTAGWRLRADECPDRAELVL
jgi:hypothetical protein